MSSSFIHGVPYIECDKCGETIDAEPGENSISILWSIAKRQGWKAERVGHDYVHTCPDCAERMDAFGGVRKVK